ncbi:MAG: class I SAM-dependent methyltransferase [Candidatus Zambryskibacteria bacterium]|nr:class I SAM-dependent methyltransferase [Candidatus Zambryskibacteria bacterium]
MILVVFSIYLLFIILSVVFILFVLAQFIAVFTTHAPFVPVPKEIEKEIVSNLNLNNDSVLFDLGCGDARILTEASLEYPMIKAVGVEIAFLPFLLAKFKTRSYKNITIKREDIFRTDLKDATHVFLYLYPKVINRLIHNIKAQCKPGTTIVSCDFELDNYKPSKVIDLQNINPNSKRGKKLFIYTV